MNNRDRLKITIIISFSLFIICAIILFISLWNKVGINTDVQIGNGMYFLILIMVVLASAMFISHMLEEGRISIAEPADRDLVTDKIIDVHDPGTYIPPFEVDLDLLAEEIIPKIDQKEMMEDSGTVIHREPRSRRTRNRARTRNRSHLPEPVHDVSQSSEKASQQRATIGPFPPLRGHLSVPPSVPAHRA